MGDSDNSRRLVAIVAADVVGYSRLMHEDERGTVAAWQQVRQEIIDPTLIEYSGRIVKRTGDGFLAEFATIESAVACAVVMQGRLVDSPLKFRMGVNLGDITDDGDDIHGDGVNIAARLEGLADPGAVCISGAVHDQVHNKLELAYEDMGEQVVKNIARPVRVFHINVSGRSVVNSDIRSPGQRPHHLATVISLAILVVVVIAGGIWYQDLRLALGLTSDNKKVVATTEDARPALIVLPFVNMSGDPKQGYFSDGFTEDVTTGLARIPGFLVVARNTAFTYKDRAQDARTIGHELGVRYVLEGSARRQGERLRVNAQLIETATGTHVWAERFDRPMNDLFIVQDSLVDRIIGTVAARLRRHESERAMLASKETLAAYDLTSRARLLFRRSAIEAMTEARELLHRAIDIDPNYAPAYSTLAQVEQFFFTSRVSDEYAQPETAKRVLLAASRAVTIAPNDAFAHGVYGMSLRMTKDYDQAAREAELARKLAPNDPQVLAPVATILLSVGDYQASVDTMQLAWTLDPHISPVFTGAVLAQGLFALGKYKASKEVALDCLAKTASDVRCLESLVRALGELGPPEQAKKAVGEPLRLSPDYTISEYKRRASKNRQDKAAIERWADGLRKAGIPE
jgi:TolB-like protein/class 3 adenylate cyclase/Tfp pilus assembly protein PilF